MKSLILLVFLSISGFSANSFAQSNCDDIRLLQSNWNNKYLPLIQITDTRFEKNSMAHKLSQAFCMIENVKLQGVDFFIYFKRFVSFAFVDLSRDINVMAQTISSQRGVRIMPGYFDPDPLWDYKRASVLVHEARHLEVNAKKELQIDDRHTYCLKGEAKVKDGCDHKFIPNWTYAGAYSYEVMFFKTLYDQTYDAQKRNDIMTWIKFILDNQFNYVDPVDYQTMVNGAAR